MDYARKHVSFGCLSGPRFDSAHLHSFHYLVILSMTIDNLKFPSVLILLVAMAVPLVDYALTDGFSPVTYVVEAICFGLFALFVGAVLVRAIYRAVKRATATK